METIHNNSLNRQKAKKAALLFLYVAFFFQGV